MTSTSLAPRTDDDLPSEPHSGRSVGFEPGIAEHTLIAVYAAATTLAERTERGSDVRPRWLTDPMPLRRGRARRHCIGVAVLAPVDVSNAFHRTESAGRPPCCLAWSTHSRSGALGESDHARQEHGVRPRRSTPRAASSCRRVLQMKSFSSLGNPYVLSSGPVLAIRR